MFDQSEPGPNADAHRFVPDRTQPSRPRIEVAARTRRAARACDYCRRLKEKCNGGAPCDRCNKSGRLCMFTNAFRRTRNPQNPGPPRSRPPPDQFDPTTFFEVERIRFLESIVQYFTGIDKCTRPNLQQFVAAAIQKDQDSPGPSSEPQGGEPGAPDVAGEGAVGNPEALPAFEEFSHSDFSRLVQQKMAPQSEPRRDSLEFGVVPAQQLLSRDSIVHEAVSLFPLSEVALLLFDVFFDVAQTNYFYVDEAFLRRKLSEFYANSLSLTISDAPWLCTTLMVFAVGTQFAHLTSGKRTNGERMQFSSPMDDTLALAFFQKATSLIPDVLAIGSVQSVQAFGLLGIYVLPIDAAGLSCTYFGIAIKIATHNGMHKMIHRGHSAQEREVRSRIWWTVYTLERRISILHGRPASINRSDIDVNEPMDLPELRPLERVNTFHNVTAQKGITEIMEDARDAMFDPLLPLDGSSVQSLMSYSLALKKLDKIKTPIAVQGVRGVTEHLQTWWGSLPDETFCRDLTPGKPLFRSNIHLALMYHLVHIFIGRSFIFDDSPAEPRDSQVFEWQNVRDELIENCTNSALASIELCQVLQDKFGLSKSSYTEFTSCCAAVLALVARRIFTKNDGFKYPCKQGVVLLKTMSTGVFATSCERRGLEILETALQKLDGNPESAPLLNGTGYAEFRNWVAMQQGVPGEVSPQNQLAPTEGWAPDNDSMQGMMQQGSMSTGQEFMSSALADLSSLPGLDEWFTPLNRLA